MVNRKRNVYTIRDWLSKFSGEDYQLIHNAKTDVKVKSSFAFIGGFVLVIFIVSFYSSTHFIYQLFNKNLVLSIPIGILWGLMIVIIYLLLLYTITPRILLGKERTIKGVKIKEPKESKTLQSISVGLRIGFVILIAMIIAQPWLITTFSPFAQVHLDKYKQQYRNNFIIQADSILILKEMKLYEDIKHEFNLIGQGREDSILMYETGLGIFKKIEDDSLFLSQTSFLKKQILKVENKWLISNRNKIDSLNNELTLLVEDEILNDSNFVLESKPITTRSHAITNLLNASNNSLISIIQDKNQQYKKLNSVLAASNFYIRKIQLINSHFPLSWLMTGLVVFAFTIPIVLKYRIRNTSNFYEVKKVMEEIIITEDYNKFKKVYSDIFFTRLNLQVNFYESCIDPPFNTTKIEEVRNCKNQNLLLNKIYSDIENSEANKYFVSEFIS